MHACLRVVLCGCLLSGHPELAKPVKLIWIAAYTTFERARPSAINDYVTLHRTELFTRLTQDMMKSIGVPIVDAANLTRSRWEATWDGMHFAAMLQGDNWGSQVASMFYQMVLNTMFPLCSSN